MAPILLFLTGGISGPFVKQDGPLLLTVTQLVAIDSGPVLVRAQLQNIGARTITLYTEGLQGYRVLVTSPASPFIDVRSYASGGEFHGNARPPPRCYQLTPGDSTYEFAELSGGFTGANKTQRFDMTWSQTFTQVDALGAISPEKPCHLGLEVEITRAREARRLGSSRGARA